MDSKANKQEEKERTSPLSSNKPTPLSSAEYVNIYESNEFKTLVSKKNKFILPVTIFFFIFYFTLPILTSFTEILHQKAIGDITWVWIYAMAQFIMVWTLVTIYVRKANTYDKDAAKIIAKAKDGGFK